MVESCAGLCLWKAPSGLCSPAFFFISGGPRRSTLSGAWLTGSVATQVTKEEVVHNLRRQSKGYQKTSSQFRGVTRHQKGKWEARIGQMIGKKYKCAPPPATQPQKLVLPCQSLYPPSAPNDLTECK